MIIKVKKLWLGHASVRDYDVQSCIDKKENLIIDFAGVTRTYPYRSLKTYLTNTYNTAFASKFNGKSYKLIDFPW